MSGASYTDFAPAAALATPPGQSALAVIRLSGEGSLELLARCFSRPGALLQAAGNTVVYGWITSHSGHSPKIDEVLISVYRAPKSYTGEDGADICCHGGQAAPAAILRLLFENGFRQALRGEFSYRAFVNGKTGLSRAEAVMEIVSAKSSLALSRSVERLSGTLENEINALKMLLLDVVSEIELYLDYSEADGVGLDASADGITARQKMLNVDERLKNLLAAYETVKLEKEGALVVLVGRPNAGKSSLFNLLLKEERSIVTEIPGTTRDWIEGWIEIEGLPIRLADTAGLRDTENTVERLGVERSLALVKNADLAVYLIDGQTPSAAAEGIENFYGAFLPVWNKCDCYPMPENFTVKSERCLPVSAKTGEGLAGLCAALAERLRESTLEKGTALSCLADGQPCPGTERQRALIAAACEALDEAIAVYSQAALDVTAPHLREALDALGEITGEISTADILESMFSAFCVGK
ncbi:MAG: tRNA uridine-5-carboxymethylaminomethyl(34) synthesis GTPase MnmE [Spirochaetaceae bacterium]|nr:tRNA uridine-5-carboxymethylaminomethyl(34) synthesis GTPase MnmE [Spirochaetaceae bacterium]